MVSLVPLADLSEWRHVVNGSSGVWWAGVGGSLLIGLSRRARARRLVAMLHCYVDDSGSEGGGPVYVLAGLIARGEQWQRLTEAWEQECACEPATPALHMAEMFSTAWPGWGDGSKAEREARRTERLRSLASIIKDCTVARVHCGVGWQAYRDLAQGRLPPRFDNPYFFLYWRLVLACVRWQHESGGPEKISFVFDRQGKIGDFAASWYVSVTEMIPEAREVLAGSPEFADDVEVVPLQAADMLAWRMRRLVAERTGDHARSAPALDVLLDVPSIGDANLTAPLLSELVDGVNTYDTGPQGGL